jgi:hypothetical protein
MGVVSSAGNELAGVGAAGAVPLGRGAEPFPAAARAPREAAGAGLADATADALPEAAAFDPDEPLHASASSPARAEARATPKEITPRMTLGSTTAEPSRKARLSRKAKKTAKNRQDRPPAAALGGSLDRTGERRNRGKPDADTRPW